MNNTVFSGRALNEISFPLGGIGAGCIGLAGNGRLIDWEIFNRPNKGSTNGHSHFAIKATKDGALVDARVINGDVESILIGGTQASDMSYVRQSVEAIKSVYSDILVEQAAGITNGQQVYDFIMVGSDAAGAASGIINAADPIAMIDEMIAATRRAADDLKKMEG